MSLPFVLMVAEKPSLAGNLANILSNGRCSSRKGNNGTTFIHEWEGTFLGKKVRYKMTSVCGHLMSLDFNGKYNNWDSVDPVQLFTCPTEKKETNPKLRLGYLLAHEARGASYVVLWLDCDKEGENICFEVINEIKDVIRRPTYGEKVIYRAKFSAITDKDIKMAMNNLVSPNENESKSVDARQELDLRIGCAFTRFQTKFFQGKYGNLDSSLISYGPCQTPTLGFCVERHDIIKTFKSEPYWTIDASILVSETRTISLSWERVRLFDREAVDVFFDKVQDCSSAKLKNISQKSNVKKRPLPLNTVELLKAASAGLGISPHGTMQIAERLYTEGYISYPRTETTHYAENFDIKGVLHMFSRSEDFGSLVAGLYSSGALLKGRTGTDVGDHPPITPLKSASRDALDSDSWRIYDYVVRHFIASVSSDCKYQVVKLDFEIGTELFSASSKLVTDAGFTASMPWLGIPAEERLPDLRPNQSLPLSEVKVTERRTSPPDYLTESELISKMEEHGIGTDASIPVHIANICQRNYVEVTGGRKLVPSNLGICLVHGYKKIDPQLVLPTMRSALEEQLNLIAKGRADFKMVLEHFLEIFRQKYIYFVRQIEAMDNLFEDTFTTLAQSGKNFSRCGACRRFMKLVASKPARLFCPNCDVTYSLPVGKSFKLYNELKCPLDQFELLTVTGNDGKGYPFCPYCYTYPPFKEMKKGSGCNLCTHPSCSYGLNANGVASCSECEDGILVLDLASAPKWQLACNMCKIIIKVCEGANKISVCAASCEECAAREISVEYRQENNKLPDGQTKVVGCLFCSSVLSNLVEQRIAVAMRRGGRGRRGRGRGRGGRGRGRKPKDKMAQLAAYFV